MRNTPSGISAEIAKGVFRPHTALTNMALSYYQNAANYFARAIFSICPVGLSSDNYYIFDKEDLLRDNWQRKPAYGKVAPAVVSEHTDTWNGLIAQGHQIVTALDVIEAVLLGGEKDRIIDEINKMSGFNSENIEEVENNLEDVTKN